MKVVATQTEGNPAVVSAVPGIHDPRDLRGRRIGVATNDVSGSIFIRMLAARQGWALSRDVEASSFADVAALRAAMGQRQIQAAVWGDVGAVSEAEGTSSILLHLGPISPKWVSRVLCVGDERIRDHSDAIRRVTRAIFHAIRFMKAQPDTAAEITAAELGWSPVAVRRAHGLSAKFLSWDGRVSVEALTAMHDFLLEHAVLTKRLSFEEIIARNFAPVRL